MRKILGYVFFIVILVVYLTGCEGLKEEQVKTIPLLRYDYAQDTLYSAEWDLVQGKIISKDDVLLKQQDFLLVSEMEWDGNGTIILPKSYASYPFTDLNTDFFQQVHTKSYRNEVSNQNWHCWKDENDRYMLTNQQNTYQLDLDDVYGIGGLTELENELIFLLYNIISGEAILYHYDIIQEIGTIKPISGFHTLMNSQLSPEKATIEQGDNFYLTNEFDIYYIDSQKNAAELIFSKNDFVDSFKEPNTEFVNLLAGCRILQFGIYQGGLVVFMVNPENMTSSWLYYQKNNEKHLVELPKNDSYYLLPDLE